MYTASIDRNTLNGLFDNQKKLDDLFDSIFDDDNYFINSVYPSKAENVYAAAATDTAYMSKQNRMRDSLLTIKEQCPYFYVLPIILEIATIYFVVTNLL